MKKIVFLVLHLGYGGVERAIVSQANLLCKKYTVEIISTYKIREKPAFLLDDKVKVKYLIPDKKPNKDKVRGALKSFNLLALFRESFKSLEILYLRRKTMINEIKNIHADYIISSRILYNRWLSKYKRSRTITIAQEHSHHHNNERYIKKLLRSLNGIDFFMPVSKKLYEFYAERIKSGTKCIYIPHFLDDIPNICSELDRFNIISIGRLSPEKGMLDLIDVFHEVLKTHNNWMLNIVGDGVQRHEIEEKIKRLKIQDNVILHGFKSRDDINSLLLNSSIYVMTSYEESFGLVLIEAQSYGLPCIAFDSAEGASEIITNGLDGYLIANRDKNEMVSKINNLIDNENIRKKLGKQAKLNSFKFSIEKIEKKWDEFLNNMN